MKPYKTPKRLLEDQETARQQHTEFLDGLKKTMKSESRDYLTPLEQELADMFEAQLLEKRYAIMKADGDWPIYKSAEPAPTFLEILEKLKNERYNSQRLVELNQK